MHIEMLTGRGSLDDFYGQAGFLEKIQRYPDQLAMRLLIAALRRSPTAPRAYAMTHMHELALRSVDDEKAREFVSIRASDEHSFFVKYLMPETGAPWPHAWVQGHATSVDEAAAMVLTAMDMSRGWAEVVEAANDAS
jgi:tRNA(Met) C34 N-acetyltransferase TmcA